MPGIPVSWGEQMRTIKTRSVADAHQELMNALIWNHTSITTEDGELTWEYPEPITVVISHPIISDMIHHNSSFQSHKCREYADQLLSGTPNEFDYDYHSRLFRYPVDGVEINQIYHSIRKLTEQPETRRAVSVTWHPRLDNGDASVPCLQFIQFIRRKHQMDMICLFRSEDILSAFGPNAYGLSQLMLYVAGRLDIPLGTYTHIVTVPHLYPIRDRAELNRWL